MELNIELLTQVLLVAALSGTATTLILQKFKENMPLLKGLWVLLLSLLLNIAMAYLIIKTIVIVEVAIIPITILVGVCGLLDAQLLYAAVKDKWQFFSANKVDIPTTIIPSNESNVVDVYEREV